jgi:hypothetical protein
MSCSPFDLRDFFLKELPLPQALQVEDHVRGCPACAEELDRLRLTEAALMSLREEEMPRRIAFVPDPALEPAGWKRAWAAFWNSGPRLGFASTAMLSVALIIFAVTRPAQAPAPPVQTAPISSAEVQQRVDDAVHQATRESRAQLTLALEQIRYYELENRSLVVNATYRRGLEGGAQ